MKTIMRLGMLVASVGLLGACAVGQEMGWHHDHVAASDVQVASCDAGTATLKGRPDHDLTHHACVEAKVRQKVD